MSVSRWFFRETDVELSEEEFEEENTSERVVFELIFLAIGVCYCVYFFSDPSIWRNSPFSDSLVSVATQTDMGIDATRVCEHTNLRPSCDFTFRKNYFTTVEGNIFPHIDSNMPRLVKPVVKGYFKSVKEGMLACKTIVADCRQGV